jgi:hypothetical protein
MSIAMLRSLHPIGARPSYDPEVAYPQPAEPDRDSNESRVETQDGESTSDRRVGSWQRALRWVAWLTFIGLAIANSDSASFGLIDGLALLVALGVSVWSLANPLGGRKATIEEPADVRGTFLSRTNWGLVLVGAVLTVGGVSAIGAIAYDLSTGRASVGDVFSDMGAFVVGWSMKVASGWSYDAHLEGTHTYALFVLVVPGLCLVGWNLVPFVKRGKQFWVGPNGSISVRCAHTWIRLLEYEYSTVIADGTTIRLTPAREGIAAVVLPQARVFSQEAGARLRRNISAEFFIQRLARRGFSIETIDAKRGSFSARRR